MHSTVCIAVYRVIPKNISLIYNALANLALIVDIVVAKRE